MPRHMRSPRPSERRHRVLFLAADPRDTTRLAQDEECAAIEHELRLTLGRDEFEFRSKWAVSSYEEFDGILCQLYQGMHYISRCTT